MHGWREGSDEIMQWLAANTAGADVRGRQNSFCSWLVKKLNFQSNFQRWVAWSSGIERRSNSVSSSEFDSQLKLILYREVDLLPLFFLFLNIYVNSHLTWPAQKTKISFFFHCAPYCWMDGFNRWPGYHSAMSKEHFDQTWASFRWMVVRLKRFLHSTTM